ncbi:MAG: thioredoxin [Thermoguttaceae bacterium]|nr:thioredoxin [Thermoguttaceae bacterium]
MSENIKIIESPADFASTIATGTVLVDFWAPWCGPCRQQLPILDKVAEKFLGKATVAKVNVDEQGELAAQFGVEAIPTLIVFKNGALVKQYTGVQSEAILSSALE